MRNFFGPESAYCRREGLLLSLSFTLLNTTAVVGKKKHVSLSLFLCDYTKATVENFSLRVINRCMDDQETNKINQLYSIRAVLNTRDKWRLLFFQQNIHTLSLSLSFFFIFFSLFFSRFFLLLSKQESRNRLPIKPETFVLYRLLEIDNRRHHHPHRSK